MEYVFLAVIIIIGLGILISQGQKGYARFVAAGCSDRVAKWLVAGCYLLAAGFVIWMVWS